MTKASPTSAPLLLHLTPLLSVARLLFIVRLPILSGYTDPRIN